MNFSDFKNGKKKHLSIDSTCAWRSSILRSVRTQHRLLLHPATLGSSSQLRLPPYPLGWGVKHRRYSKLSKKTEKKYIFHNFLKNLKKQNVKNWKLKNILSQPLLNSSGAEDCDCVLIRGVSYLKAVNTVLVLCLFNTNKQKQWIWQWRFNLSWRKNWNNANKKYFDFSWWWNC